MNRQGAAQHMGVLPKMYRTPLSVYGGAGGGNTRISMPRQVENYLNIVTGKELLIANEKMTMQNLNDRLASYLEKVSSLEQSNFVLEKQIKQWYEAHTSTSSKDYSAYYKQINELQAQIKENLLQNTRLFLNIDNTRLASDDFKMKFETERRFCLVVESDLERLHKVLDGLTLGKTDLELQIEELSKDLVVLKKEHEEEVAALRRQLGTTVNVEVDATPGQNLIAIITEMRKKYEVMAQESVQKLKDHYDKQISTVQEEVSVSTGGIKESEDQLRMLRQNYQTLEIDCQSHRSVKESLERTLEETKARYFNRLARIKEELSSLKSQLKTIRDEAEHHTTEYNVLLDLKMRLEQEIATYRRLLEGEDIDATVALTALENKETKVTKKIKMVMEEMVDGKVVSSQVKEMEENI
ncbi:PREDICTED: keratin, type I cytoskeletal 20 [Condylura cristata]|uniref:keratin, type I cytoskeletal 20 n=1 Tax=Condylura cristata TaxID=143302 RepID=UPI0006437107|nr:PREDICTED: keratin, type I cytoskeletal 20 [Condylura cristata]